MQVSVVIISSACPYIITKCTTGQAPAAWAIGARCQAYSSLDGNWYTATVTGVSAAEHFVVQLEQGGPEEEVRFRPYRGRPQLNITMYPGFSENVNIDAKLGLVVEDFALFAENAASKPVASPCKPRASRFHTAPLLEACRYLSICYLICR